MTDHAERIEELARKVFGSTADQWLLQAAAEIRRLQSENARFQKALDELRSRFGHLGK